MGPTWGPSGSDRIQVGPMLAQWTLLSGIGWKSCFEYAPRPPVGPVPLWRFFYFEPIGTAVRWGSHTMALIQVTSYWPPATFALVRRPIPMFWYVQNICRDPADQTIFLLSHTASLNNASIHASSYRFISPRDIFVSWYQWDWGILTEITWTKIEIRTLKINYFITEGWYITRPCLNLHGGWIYGMN